MIFFCIFRYAVSLYVTHFCVIIFLVIISCDNFVYTICVIMVIIYSLSLHPTVKLVQQSSGRKGPIIFQSLSLQSIDSIPLVFTHSFSFSVYLSPSLSLFLSLSLSISSSFPFHQFCMLKFRGKYSIHIKFRFQK